ncbi:hypothetical protein TWF225_010297 [Orbilia oligospora]|uniref:Uncharacterized protein n=1 Tax=Orbilia oligospora TaxID=2813651 RepID=A0A7C8K1F0_ORBOL|nr:hypothetical protein TWF751_011451 [Orbilia oligospora]KAF3172542.1 hypothetical protein TWF225_010297 [Orbilia oligospora]KAF3236270.1 hypothetical protein TWF128_001426 [Orbilia oligospora]KAF3241654.1 hypothetical protein TWF217_011978 [Orbilia oligospora]TGJ63551.1 hypothetical protein EYR41_011464 [Orbilia oligospora]
MISRLSRASGHSSLRFSRITSLCTNETREPLHLITAGDHRARIQAMDSSSPPKDAAAVLAWSIAAPPKPLPAINQIKRICVIDFDNTLYRSPVPSNIWDGPSIGILRDRDRLLGGGWWQTPSILDATVDQRSTCPSVASQGGHERRYPDRWNKPIVDIARTVDQNIHTLNVLLTGRSRILFSKTVLRILGNAGFNFDLVVLKQDHPQLGHEFATTMDFKKCFISMILNYYHEAERISIYEDRPGHSRQFRDFGDEFNKSCIRDSLVRPQVRFDVIQVQPAHRDLDPLEEIKQVKFMLQRHNRLAQNMDASLRPLPAKLFKRVCHTSYMLHPETTHRLLVKFRLRQRLNTREVDFLGRYIPIKMGKCEPVEIENLGGIGAQIQFETVSFGSYNDCIWAVRVRPVGSNVVVSTMNAIPTIVLAKRTDVAESFLQRIENWEDIRPGDPRYLRFSATVCEQLRLQISAPKLHLGG